MRVGVGARAGLGRYEVLVRGLDDALEAHDETLDQDAQPHARAAP